MRRALAAGMLAGIALSIGAGLAEAALLSFAGFLAAVVLFAACVESHPSGPAAILDNTHGDRDD